MALQNGCIKHKGLCVGRGRGERDEYIEIHKTYKFYGFTMALQNLCAGAER